MENSGDFILPAPAPTAATNVDTTSRPKRTNTRMPSRYRQNDEEVKVEEKKPLGERSNGCLRISY
jgi:hypothetical protein